MKMVTIYVAVGQKNSDECGGICNAFVGATLEERECKIRFPSTGESGWYAVALVIEDFPTRLATEALSSVPLQFLVNVFEGTEECTTAPEFIGTTRADGSCVGVPFNSTFSEKVIAYSGSQALTVKEIQTVSPQGLTKSELRRWSIDNHTSYINISYTPPKSIRGPEVFCFTAISSSGSSSRQSCITLVVGVSPPLIVPGSNDPTGLVMPSHAVWKVSFDREFVRPTRRSFIKFRNSEGIDVLKIDASTSLDVSFPLLGNTLQFKTRILLKERETYSILMDPGIVKGTEYCGPESEAIRNISFWKIRIRDVTPPKLTFLPAPAVTNRNASISWTFDESVAVQVCTHQNPRASFRVGSCNNSWSGKSLEEGIHSLYVEATDLEGNIAPSSRYSWSVDLTPPTLYIRSQPSNISNVDEFTFAFYCDEQCTISCAVTQKNSQPNKYYPCNSGSYKTGKLLDGLVYSFHARPKDRVNNIGDEVVYSFEIDQTPPVLGQLYDRSVACGSSYDPVVTGYPSVSDNRDPSPKLSYEDRPSSGCSVERIWTVVDSAGNKVQNSQTIVFTSRRPPNITLPTGAVVPCGSTSDISGDSVEFKETIKVVHPCNREFNITFKDSDLVDRCGFSFWRTWTVTDDCGEKSSARQKITVLPLQLPESPQNKELNVHLKKVLRWPQYPGAVSYQVFFWYRGEQKPQHAVSVTNYRYYRPTKPYEPGSRIFWQIMYVVAANQLVPSPVWGFETKSFPDLAVIEVMIPTYTFSGSSLKVSWRVQNKGNVSTIGTIWSDAVYMSKLPNKDEANLVTQKSQRNFLDSGDWYTSSTSFLLAENDLGNRYIFVETNVRRSVDEINYVNNVGTSAGPMSIKLTPPPDLQVTEVVHAPSTFSGVSISLQWTVKNLGVGATKGSSWYDTIYWCTNVSIDDCQQTLATIRRFDGLVPGASYNVTTKIFVPNSIYGNFFVLVETDSRNSIYEHSDEDNNVGTAKFPILVTLTPPPDLVVDDILVSGNSSYFTFENIEITYRITNRGSTAPFEPYWYDKVMIYHTASTRKQVISKFAFSGVLNPGKSYSKKANFIIPASFEPGAYEITVEADYYGNVFEFNAENNNNDSKKVVITQRLPDLDVSDMRYLLRQEDGLQQLIVNWTITNIGKASTLNFQWSDSLYLRQINLKKVFHLKDQANRFTINFGESYTSSGIFQLPSHMSGKAELSLSADVNGQLDETIKANNKFFITINVPLILSDLLPVSFKLVNDGDIYPNSVITLKWKVKNAGKRKVTEPWQDSFYLLSTDSSVQIFLGKLKTHKILRYGKSTEAIAKFKVPEDIYPGIYSIEIRVNSPSTLYEGDHTSNNNAKTNIFIQYPPAADLVVTSLTYDTYDAGNAERFVTVSWKGKNIGNSMRSKTTWEDKITLTSRNDNVDGSEEEYELGSFSVTAALETNQEYSVKKILPLPPAVQGTIQVKITCNYKTSFREVGGENNNVKQGVKNINVGRKKSAKLAAKFLSNLPTNALYFSSFAVTYSVKNVGNHPTSSYSWIDALYLYEQAMDSVMNVKQRGIQISNALHIGMLDIGKTYYANVSVNVPEIPERKYFFHLIIDLGDRAKERTLSYSNQTVIIEAGPLPDLDVTVEKGNEMLARNGSPVKLKFNVTNIGYARTHKEWFDTIYLSDDATLDPFDWHLGVSKRPRNIGVNESYMQTIHVFLPFDLVSREYYLIFITDSRDELIETNNENNKDVRLIKILESPSSDLFVRHVQAPDVASINTKASIQWSLGNNGSLATSGYRCDVVYFSKDDKIDFEDFELGEPTCRQFTIEASGNDRTNDIKEMKQVNVPSVEQATFQTIVKTRSNIKDLHPENNIGITSNGTFINITTLLVDGKTLKTQLNPQEEKYFLIPDALPEQTLVVTLKSDRKTDINNLYLRENKQVSSFQFDERSSGEISSGKVINFQSTKAVDYYLLVQNVGSLVENRDEASNIELMAKYAKFEITSIFPTKAAPLGRTTLRIKGTLFPEYAKLFLKNIANSTEVVNSVDVYRSSSTEMYATFDLGGLSVGTKYDLWMADSQLVSNKVNYTKPNGAFELFSGVPGKVSFKIESTEALRVGETGFVTVRVFNKGDTDASLNVFLFSIENVQARLLTGDIWTDYRNGIFFIPVSSDGPGGILIPKSHSEVLFEIKPARNVRQGRIQIQMMGSSTVAPHIYLSAKDLLKPTYFTDAQWDVVWENFINLVGTTEASLTNRLNKVSTYLSTVNRRIYSIDELIKFLIEIADGTFLTGSQPLTVEDTHLFEVTSRTLVLRRKYSFSLSLRYSTGAMGKGWILPWWDTRIIKITPSEIFLQWEREQYIFVLIESREYSNVLLGQVFVKNTSNSLVLKLTNENLEYHYDIRSKLLMLISYTKDKVNISVTYNNISKLPEKFETSFGDFMHIKYDGDGKLKSMLSSNMGKITTSNYEYEEKTGLLKLVNTNGQKAEYFYEENGFLSNMHLQDNSQIKTKYGSDKLLKNVSFYSPLGTWLRTTVYKRSFDGQIQAIEQPLGLVTTYKYDDRSILAFEGKNLEKPLKIRDEVINKLELQGDEVVLKTTLTADKQRFTQTNARGDSMEIFYDDNGNIKKYDMHNGAVYTASYDDKANLRELVYPDSSKETLEYESVFGNVVKEKTRKGGEILNYYDDFGNIIKQVVDGSEKYYSYNQDSKMITATNEIGTISIDYTNEGLPSYVTYPDNYTLIYGYDKEGRRSSLSHNGKQYINYTYEPVLGKLSKITERDEVLLEVEYNRYGRVSRRTLGNGMYTEYVYDSKLQNLRKLTNYYANGSISTMFEYSYDTRGRRVSMNTTEGTWFYGYDSESQLTSVKTPFGEITRYSYDNRGNRRTKEKDGQLSSYSVNELDQYVTNADLSFSYNENGNLISKVGLSRQPQVFQFNDDNKLIHAKQVQKSCRYVYDALGNLYEKICEDGERTRFIIDPYSVWGSDVSAKVSNRQKSLYIHSKEHGLIARSELESVKHMYYEFDPQGSVTKIIDDAGDVLNSYGYDSFGYITQIQEKVANDYQFVGQWGVTACNEIPNIYNMRARFYDAEAGRFISTDPLLFEGRSRNLYAYVKNDPISLIDPSGTVANFLICPALGAAANSLVYLGNQKLTGQKITTRGIVGSAVSGALGTSLGYLTGKLASFIGPGTASNVLSKYFGVRNNFVSTLTGEVISQSDKKTILESSLISSATGLIPLPKFSKSSCVDEAIKNAINSGLANAVIIFLRNQTKPVKKNIERWLNKSRQGLKDIWDGFQSWLQSFDPNDIIGPRGFGDLKFVPPKERMIYKIRFENAENATAPAQRVHITIKLDEDFDLRTFRLGSYGFGDFVADVKGEKSFLQNKIQLADPHNLYLRIQAGLDVVEGEAYWTFQSVDPGTGLSPTDPRRGFLPPNNGTSGQGFVVFSITSKENLESFTRIDAKATIYFDKNEPIETPPIFNTIDASYPEVNVSLLNETTQTGTPLVTFLKSDVGSGIRNVDLYIANASANGGWSILMEDVSENVAILPLPTGSLHEILVIGEDNVGNRDTTSSNIQTLFIPEFVVSCLSVNNCSGYGVCIGLDLCECVIGRYGSDCSETSPPVEPPIIEFNPYHNITTPGAVSIAMSSRLVQSPPGTVLKIIFSNLPDGFIFNNGKVVRDGKVVLDGTDLANLTITPPPGFSGYLNLTVTAVAIQGERNASRSGKLFIYFMQPVIGEEEPTLITRDICLNTTKQKQAIPLSDVLNIRGLHGNSRSQHNVKVVQTRFKITVQRKIDLDLMQKDNYTMFSVDVLQFVAFEVEEINKTFTPLNVTVHLLKSSSSAVVDKASFVVSRCKADVPEDEEVTSSVSIAGIVFGVLAAVVLLVVIICCLRKKCCGRSLESGSTTISMTSLKKHY